MRAFIAPTDRDWFDFLSAAQGIDEVNFWMPNPWGGSFNILKRGEPLLFKLKSPINAIVGGGFFQHYSELPISLAWDAFGIKNGASSRQELWDRTARLRGGRPAWYEDFAIGCILLAEPFFWPESEWIPQPEDWKKNIVRGKTYDLRQGIGERLWSDVVARLQTQPVSAGGLIEIPGGYEIAETRRRIGQGIFRVVLTDAYGRACAITRERALPALEAAHIKPFSETEAHDLRNGLLLRSDVHRLFDAGYITVTPELRVEASRRMREDFNDGENYLRLHGSIVEVPASKEARPDPDLLRWHNENRFRG